MSLEALTPHPSSFRDPNARIHVSGDRILRQLTADAIGNFRHVRATGVLDHLSNKGWVVPSTELEPEGCGAEIGSAREPALWLEHPRLPFISYPYEWPFRALQRAAVLQLEIYLEALKKGVTLADATAYNIQFDGARPVFIDIASFRPYKDGELWAAHGQFCEQFLNPLLLQAYTAVPYNPWYRGALEGIPTNHLASLLPYSSGFDWRVFTNVFMQARLQRSATGGGTRRLRQLRQRRLPRRAFEAFLRQLHGWILKLKPAGVETTTWRQYEATRLYDKPQQEARLRFVRRFVASVRPAMLWDLGCNAGEFSAAALESGAQRVIGFDYDHGALAAAYDRAEFSSLPFLPLFLDAANPSPNQGWAERERQGLMSRGPADALLALAFEHHLTIGRNIPLPEFLDWLLRLAPTGVVEFVAKQDPQIQTMLAIREDIFPSYSLEVFMYALGQRATIVEHTPLTDSSRHLFWYRR